MINIKDVTVFGSSLYPRKNKLICVFLWKLCDWEGNRWRNQYIRRHPVYMINRRWAKKLHKLFEAFCAREQQNFRHHWYQHLIYLWEKQSITKWFFYSLCKKILSDVVIETREMFYERSLQSVKVTRYFWVKLFWYSTCNDNCRHCE